MTKRTNGERIINLLKTGVIQPFDEKYSNDETFEDVYIDKILKNKWVDLDYFEKEDSENSSEEIKEILIGRRGLLKIVDQIRNKIPKGDEI